jgi:hypothetical protein
MALADQAVWVALRGGMAPIRSSLSDMTAGRLRDDR